MAMNKKLKAKWVDALRSRKYKQCRSVLHDTATNSYCCLGVLEMVQIGKVTRNVGAYPRKDLRCGLSITTLDELIDKNDGEKWGFKRIATFIEKNL